MTITHIDAAMTNTAPASAASAPLGALELTILMPCLNEAATVGACIRKAKGFLDRAGILGEVLIGDNGSTDGSQAIAEREGARVVAIPERGYGAALIGGIAAARGAFVIMGDADDSYDFSNLDGFVATLRGGADLVMGNRFSGGIKPGAMPFLHRYLGNPVLSFLGRLFYRIPVGDFHCGLRGFRAAAIRSLGLRAPGMEFASEMVVKAAINGLKIAETPTTLSPDGRGRPPHLRTWRDGWRHLRFLLLHSPRWLFFYPAMAMIGAGIMLVALTALSDMMITRTISIGVHSLLVGCFGIIVGAQLLSFAVLSRQHALQEGYLPSRTMGSLLDSITLERILQVAGLLFVLGVAGFAWSVASWARVDFGPLVEGPLLRLLAVSLSLITVAVQLASSGFLASTFRIRGGRVTDGEQHVSDLN